VLNGLFQDTKPPCQDVLESRFLANAEVGCCFEVEEFQYELDFQTMTQTNLRTQTKRQVSRRPCFLSELDVRTGGLYVIFFYCSVELIQSVYHSGYKLDLVVLMMTILMSCFTCSQYWYNCELYRSVNNRCA